MDTLGRAGGDRPRGPWHGCDGHTRGCTRSVDAAAVRRRRAGGPGPPPRIRGHRSRLRGPARGGLVPDGPAARPGRCPPGPTAVALGVTGRGRAGRSTCPPSRSLPARSDGSSWSGAMTVSASRLAAIDVPGACAFVAGRGDGRHPASDDRSGRPDRLRDARRSCDPCRSRHLVAPARRQRPGRPGARADRGRRPVRADVHDGVQLGAWWSSPGRPVVRRGGLPDPGHRPGRSSFSHPRRSATSARSLPLPTTSSWSTGPARVCRVRSSASTSEPAADRSWRTLPPASVVIGTPDGPRLVHEVLEPSGCRPAVGGARRVLAARPRVDGRRPAPPDDPGRRRRRHARAAPAGCSSPRTAGCRPADRTPGPNSATSRTAPPSSSRRPRDESHDVVVRPSRTPVPPPARLYPGGCPDPPVGSAGVAAHGPDPIFSGRWNQNQALAFSWRSGLRAAGSVYQTAIKAAAADASATRGSQAATFAYGSGSSNLIGYGTGATCSTAGIACFTRNPTSSFTMWMREQGHRFDWGALRWCQAYSSWPDGCFDVENIILDEFGHVEILESPQHLFERVGLSRRPGPDGLARQAEGRLERACLRALRHRQPAAPVRHAGLGSHVLDVSRASQRHLPCRPARRRSSRVGPPP